MRSAIAMRCSRPSRGSGWPVRRGLGTAARHLGVLRHADPGATGKPCPAGLPGSSTGVRARACGGNPVPIGYFLPRLWFRSRVRSPLPKWRPRGLSSRRFQEEGETHEHYDPDHRDRRIGPSVRRWRRLLLAEEPELNRSPRSGGPLPQPGSCFAPVAMTEEPPGPPRAPLWQRGFRAPRAPLSRAISRPPAPRPWSCAPFRPGGSAESRSCRASTVPSSMC